MGAEYWRKRSKTQFRAQNETSNGEDFHPAVSAAVYPNALGKSNTGAITLGYLTGLLERITWNGFIFRLKKQKKILGKW